MKITWEPSDIRPGAWVYYAKNIPSLDALTDIGYLASVTYQIGYINADAGRLCLISVCDGMVTGSHTHVDIARDLTEGNYLPLPFKHLIEVVKYLRECRA